MIPIRFYAYGALISSLLAGIWYIHHHGYNAGKATIQAEWDKDKAEKKRAADKQAEASRELERVANEKTRQAQKDYAKAKAALDAALAGYDGVCSAETVPRDYGLRMAGSAENSMSGLTSGTIGTITTAETSTHARPSFKFSDAMSDTLQCSRLIEWVKDQGM